jgi:hypothetical protein
LIIEIYYRKDLILQTLPLPIFMTIALLFLFSYSYNNYSFAFHTPNSGYTIIGKTLYANNGSDHLPTPQFPQFTNQSGNDINKSKIPMPLLQQQPSQQQQQLQQPSQQQQQQQLQQPSQQQQLFLNKAQNIDTTTIAMDVAKHIHLAREALQFGNAKVILQQLNLAEMKLSLIVQKNNTSSLDNGGAGSDDTDGYSDSELKELEAAKKGVNAQRAELEELEEEEEQSPRISSALPPSARELPQRERIGYGR